MPHGVAKKKKKRPESSVAFFHLVKMHYEAGSLQHERASFPEPGHGGTLILTSASRTV